MKLKLYTGMTIAALLMAAPAVSQETTPAGNNDPNEIFRSMMQAMPEDMKTRVDSASSVRQISGKNELAVPSSPEKSGVPAAPDAMRNGLDDLPEDVRAQVRKTMQELEQENRQRMLQFKEMKSSGK